MPKGWVRIRLRIGTRLGVDWVNTIYTIVYTQRCSKTTKLCLKTENGNLELGAPGVQHRTSRPHITAICTQLFSLFNFLWATDQDSVKQSHYLFLVWRLPCFTLDTDTMLLMFPPKCVFLVEASCSRALLIYLSHPGFLSRSDVWNQWLWNYSQPF